MKKVQKKVLIGVLVVLFTLFGGCKSSSDKKIIIDSVVDQNENSAVNAVDPQSRQRLNTVKWAVPDVYSVSADTLKHINKFLEEKELDFEIQFIPLDFNNYMQACLDYENKNGPLDIVSVGLSDSQSIRGKLLNDGYCASINVFLTDNPEIKSLFSEDQWKSGSLEGVYYLFPSWPNYNKLRYAFNDSDVSDADLKDFSGTVQQMVELWSRATKEKPIFIDVEIERLLPFDLVAGVAISHETGQAVNVFSEEGYGELIRYLNSLYVSRRLALPSPEGAQDNHYSYTAYITANAKWKPPKGYLLRESKPYVVSRLVGVGVRSASANLEKVFSFLKLLYSDAELANLLIYGEQDVDYKVVDGYAFKPDGTPADSFINELCLGASIYKGVLPSKSIGWGETRPQNLGPNPVKYIEENTLPSPILGFYPDVSGYEEQVAMLERIVIQFMNQTPVWQVVPGEDNNVLPNMGIEDAMAFINNKMKEADIDEWLVEVNRQLEEYGIHP